jgi:hypothetical protein
MFSFPAPLLSNGKPHGEITSRGVSEILEDLPAVNITVPEIDSTGDKPIIDYFRSDNFFVGCEGNESALSYAIGRIGPQGCVFA